jgi:hypothetical protein
VSLKIPAYSGIPDALKCLLRSQHILTDGHPEVALTSPMFPTIYIDGPRDNAKWPETLNDVHQGQKYKGESERKIKDREQRNRENAMRGI